LSPVTHSGPVTNVAVDGDGNVLAAGWADDKTTSAPGDARLTVLKLDPAGQLLWHREIDAGGGTPFSGIATPVGLVVDASGNPIVAALMTFTVNMDLNDAWIIKLSGSDGSETWRYIKLDKSMTDIALAGSDVAAVGLRWVARVDGGTGMLSWEKDVPDTYFWTVTVDPAGDIVAGASDNDFSTGGAVAVRKFAGANGDTLWTYPAPGPTHVVFRVRTDPSGNVGVAGTNGTGSLPGNHPFVARLSGATGTQLFLTDFSGTDAGTVLDFSPGHPLARHIGFDVDGAATSGCRPRSGPFACRRAPRRPGGPVRTHDLEWRLPQALRRRQQPPPPSGKRVIGSAGTRATARRVVSNPQLILPMRSHPTASSLLP
jgi:hypothetical protein